MRAKFAKHIAILILVDATASALGFYLFGFAFAYGDEASEDGLNPSGNDFIGKMLFAMYKMAPTAYYQWVFQWTVCHYVAIQARCLHAIWLLHCIPLCHTYIVLLVATYCKDQLSLLYAHV